MEFLTTRELNMNFNIFGD